VIAGLWLPTSGSEASEGVLARDPEWAAPLLWRSELCSVLAGYLRRGALDLARAARIAEDAEQHLGRREYRVASFEVLRRVAGSRCSAYDCEFVALAEELGVPLVTGDREILQAFPGVAVPPETFAAR
ncbi:MAG TPA: type II toxin-antitoxin system VapC family toxin, partial [Anaeromyxobacteraceae bacterium]|nr:type II toxin-antitoxin system VapC family toxin [Anaeromyxobacteraceae bacterium]